MKYKKIMLVALVLLAILTLGAVSASEDIVSDDLAISAEAADNQLSLENDVNDVLSDENSTNFEDNDDEGDNSYFLYVTDNDEIITDSESEDYDENAIIGGIILLPNTEDGHLDIFTDDDVEIYSLIVRAVGEGDWHIDENGNLKSHIFLKDLNLTNVNDGDRVNFIYFDENGDKVDDYTCSRTIEIAESYIKFIDENSDDGGDDAEDGVIINVLDGDQKEFDLNNDLEETFAFISVSDELQGFIRIYTYDEEEDEWNIFFEKSLSEITNQEADEENEGFTVYSISLSDFDEKLTEVLEERCFEIGFWNDEDDRIDNRAYNIEYYDDGGSVKFWENNGDDEGDDEEDGPIVSIFVDTSKDYPTSGDGDESLITVYAQNGEEYHVAIFSSKKFFFDKNLTDFENIVPVEGDEELEGYYKYEITLNDVDFFNGSDDGDKIWIGVYKIEDCYKWMDASSTYNVIFNGNSSFRLLEGLDIRIFYGNLTSGETEEGMITFTTDKFIEINIPSSSSAVGVNVAVDFGDETKTYSLDDFDFEEVSDEEFSGKIYYIELNDEIKNIIRQHENQNITFNLSYGFNGKSISSSFKRILIGDVFYKINTISDLNYLFDFNIAGDVLNSSDKEAVNIFCFDGNWHWAHNDLGGGYFKVYVNDNCVESLELHSQLVDYSPRGVSFSLDDLGISTSGNYTIKITQLPDNETEIDEETGKIMPQYKLTSENEIISKDVVVNFEDVYEPVDPELTVELSKDEYEFEEIIEITIRSLASPVTVSVDGKTYTINIVDGVGILQIPNLNAGTYTVIAISEKTDLYHAGEVNKTFIVNKVDVPLTLSVADIEVGQTAVLNIEMGKAINDVVLVSLAGNNYTASLTGGKASLDISDLKAGDYEAVAIYAGNINYNSVLNTTSFKVSKLTPSVEVTVGEAVEGSDLDVTVEVPDATGSVVVNGVSVALVDGKAVATIENLVAGDLTVEVNYAGDDKYLSASKNVTVVVKAKESPDLTVSVEDISFGESAIVKIIINADVTGKVTVDGNEVEIADGKGTYTISGLNAGNYTVAVSFAGDKYFNADEKTASFKVLKLTPSVEVTVGEAVEGSDLDVTVEVPDATGSVVVNGVSVALVDGKAVATIENLVAGDLTVEVNYAGDDKYLSASKNVTVVVKAKESPDLTVSVEDISFGESAIVKIIINADVTGKVTVDGNEVEIADGKGTYTISGLNAGNYTVAVSFAGDKYFNADEKTAAFKVNKVDSTLTVDDVELDYGESKNVSVSADGATGIVAKIDGADVACDGFVVQISDLSAGTHTLSVTTVPDENHNEITKTAKVTVNKIKSTLDLTDDITFTYGESGSTNVSFTGATDVNVKVINQSGAVVTVNDGVITVSGLDAGSYVLEVTTVPDESHSAVTKRVNITVGKLATKVSASKVTTTYGTSKNIVVTLKDANGNVLANQKVSVKLNNVVYTKTTNAKGQVSIAVPKTLAVKNAYTATITFAGDDNHAKSTGSVKVVVNKATPKLTASAKSFKRTTKTKKYTVTLKTDKNAAMKNVKVTIKVNGKTYNATTNSKGQATFKITKLTKKGKFTALVKFAGNSKYKAVSKKPKITVK
nr:hypothetical protein [uncultured Methanobrevibacter sp.]